MRNYRIFFAIPFDPETKGIHEDFVIRSLKDKYRGEKNITYSVGYKQIGWSVKYDDIESFKMQNSDLFKHFVKQIRNADIVIADLTGNNPNVHVELGIALSYNKNILRVTRQAYEGLGFDVRNYKVEQYKTKEGLLKTVFNYLKLFFKIKELDFKDYKPEISKLFYKRKKGSLLYWNQQGEKSDLPLQHIDSSFYMRDGKVQVTFEMTKQTDDSDWFGVYLRAQHGEISRGSILVYSRKNGNLEIASYPAYSNPKVIAKSPSKSKLTGEKTLIIELEGDSIKANIDKQKLECSDLDLQSTGEVKFACHRSNVDFWKAEIICRDSIETFDKFS
jgi:hypothetical protein